MIGVRTIGAVVLLALAGLVTHATAGAQQAQEKNAGSRMRVGTFDSRALAMAYYRSAAFRRHMDGLRAEYEEAKAAKDKKRRQELEAESANPTWPDSGWPPSPAQQGLIHKQGFSTWPVDNVLSRIEDRLPQIAGESDVQVIVSKWDLAYRGPDAEFVDVTDLMVQLFDPDEQTLGIVEQIRAQEPVPLEQLGHDQD